MSRQILISRFSVGFGFNKTNVFHAVRCFSSERKITPAPTKPLEITIFTECKKLESREIRQNELYWTFVDNVKTRGRGLICIENLATKYNMSAKFILQSLYYHALQLPKNRGCIVNPFRLPYEQKVESDHFPLGYNLNDAYKELEIKYREKNSVMNKDGLTRYLHEDPKRPFVVIKKNDSFDVVFLIRHRVDNEVMLSEVKNPYQHMSQADLSVVLQKADVFYVNRLGNITIRNAFNGLHQYDMSSYDEFNGSGEFISAILKAVSSRLDLFGELSIKHHSTEKLIKNSLLVVTGSDTELGKKLYEDFIKYTQHALDDTIIDVDRLLDEYNIDMKYLLQEMYNNTSTSPTNLEQFLLEQRTNTSSIKPLSLEYAGHLVKKSHNLENVHLSDSFANVISIVKGESIFINIKKFDDSTFRGNFYECLFNSMISRLSRTKQNNEYMMNKK